MRRRDVAAVLTLLTALVVAGQPAQAGPVPPASTSYPTRNDVRRAQQHTTAVGAQVAALQRRLSAASAQAQAADLALSMAAEDFDAARVELADSRQTAKLAVSVAAQAVTRLQGAQNQVGRLAAQTYRAGGPLSSLEVLFSPTGPGDVLERASMIHTLGEQQQRQVQQLDGARVVAGTLQTQAAQALAKQTAAANKLAKARAVAQQRATAARSTLAAEQATRAALLVQLAAAQKTTVAVARARQEGLAAAARRAAQQRLQQARVAAAQRLARSVPNTAADQHSSAAGTQGSARSSGSEPDPGSSSGSSTGSGAVAWAEHQVGLPYRWGADGPGSYDCSGLVMRAWQQAGVALPHSSRIQYQEVEKISYSELRPGDLVFFATDTSNPATIHHVAMYLGGGQMIEAPYTGANVRIVALRTSGSMPFAGRP